MVEYRKIKTLEGLKKDPTQDKREKIPETTGAVLIHDDGDMRVTITPQSALTSDCWLVQFNGFQSCVDCEVYLQKDCGGGSTLAKMIIDHFKDSIMTKWKFNEYWGGETGEEDLTFFNFVKWTQGKYVFYYSFKKYKRHIKSLQTQAEEPDGPDLDGLYPFLDAFEDPKSLITSQTGYHQHHQCECVRTTKKGSYRDVIIERTDETGTVTETLYYYHQHCVMVRKNGTIWLNSAGFRTKTTRERINGYLQHWDLTQDKYVWYLVKRQWIDGGYKTIEGPIRFYDGIKLEDI